MAFKMFFISLLLVLISLMQRKYNILLHIRFAETKPISLFCYSVFNLLFFCPYYPKIVNLVLCLSFVLLSLLSENGPAWKLVLKTAGPECIVSRQRFYPLSIFAHSSYLSSSIGSLSCSRIYPFSSTSTASFRFSAFRLFPSTLTLGIWK